MKSTTILLLLFTFLTSSCTSSHRSVEKAPSDQLKRGSLPDIVYLIDKENVGHYKPIEIAKENRPEPKQGINQWTMDFYGSIRYPALARENGIGGVVILDIAIDQNGKVTDISIKKGISKECDNEAKRAYLFSIKDGYNPLVIDGSPAKFKIELPVQFRLE
ncbi:MAG TPA: energy transducer TonB [Saprospiraceae bacterium]|nr:energy transducer TonB [Saprospiraceae bacterium]